METLTKAMKEDPDYAFGWHCNIAMACFDAMPESTGDEYTRQLKVANEGATRFMKLCFDVETKGNQ